jgi:hypothetical protein
MRARARLAVAALDGASDRLAAVVIENQVRPITGALKPALNAVLRTGDSGADGTLSSRAVGIGRGRGNIAFAVEAFAKLIVRASYVLA